MKAFFYKILLFNDWSYGIMALWVDKYCPKGLDQLEIHPAINRQLKALTSAADLPHLLMCGPSGAGKKTRILAILRDMFGPGIEHLRMDQRSFKTNSDRKVDIVIISSNYHIEVTPSDAGIYDRIIIQDLIKEVAQTRQLDMQASRNFKVVVINEADGLTKEAQHALRRTMEKYTNNMRVILCCNSISKIIGPIRSRCLLIRIPLPTESEVSANQVYDVLQTVASHEHVSLPTGMAKRLVVASDRNLRKALLMFEASKARQYPFHENQEIELAEWEKYIAEMAQMIAKEEQTPDKLLQIRGKFYDLLNHCISATTIIRTLTFELMRHVDDELKMELIHHSAFYEHRIQTGTKAIFHLEAFVAKFMSIYKRFLLEVYD